MRIKFDYRILISTSIVGIIILISLGASQIAQQNQDPKATQSDGVRPAVFAVQTFNWSTLEINASVPVHFNINQPAKAEDSSAEFWVKVFHEEGVQTNQTDTFYFCGWEKPFFVQMRVGEVPLPNLSEPGGSKPCVN